MNEPTGRTVILGVAASDAHAVANRLIAMQLTGHGFTVVNLGVCTPLTEFATALLEHPEAEAVLIGSVNGHAVTDLADLPRLRAAGLLDRPVVVGGNLSVGSRKDGRAAERLRELGVDHVLTDATELVLLLDVLRAATPVGAVDG
ncbi:cobalamin-dependent protein [Saccharothrix sp. BKS2]|uniref:cobalamin-dependent protein n=1 Tax=Saccharothrix sp. BKS2 TaxID=3064400 RepID=UPI0039ED14CB